MVYEVVEKVGTSTDTIEDAIRKAVLSFGADVNIGWFEVIEQRGRVTSDKKVEFQVKVKVGISK